MFGDKKLSERHTLVAEGVANGSTVCVKPLTVIYVVDKNTLRVDTKWTVQRIYIIVLQ